MDKLAHVFAYALLTLSFGLCCSRAWWLKRPLRTALLVGAVILAFGTADELHQYFVASRDASILDWAADLLGVLAGSAVSWSLARRGRVRHGVAWSGTGWFLRVLRYSIDTRGSYKKP